MDDRRAAATITNLLAIILMVSVFTGDYVRSRSLGATGAETAPVPRVSLRAGSGAEIPFTRQADRWSKDLPQTSREVPHLVLRRNGALTDLEQRTLIVEATGISVPPPGVLVSLTIETQHREPNWEDMAAPSSVARPSVGGKVERPDGRIPVWREAQWIPNTSTVTETRSARFIHAFGATVLSGSKSISTPTDYFRYDLLVINGRSNLSGSRRTSGVTQSASLSFSADYAFLMENQWTARLPEVQEQSEAAAPDELIVYFCDMFPFQKDAGRPGTRLAREEVSAYVGTKLVPHMVEAFRIQTDEWGFPWYDEWTSYRRADDAKRLSVALSDGRTWFHGRPPVRGHSAISIRVTGGKNVTYATLTDAVISNFHHELFHSVQRNINQHYGGNGNIDGQEEAWQFFTEGTAVLASSVGQEDSEFKSKARAYMSRANRFIGYGHAPGSDLNSSYETINPYDAAIYWRFLYEQCGRTEDGALDPAVGMQVIRQTLTTLYAGEVVDVSQSANLIGVLPKIMDRVLSEIPCAFDTHAESQAAFSSAIYALQLENDWCVASGTAPECGFYDPYEVYTAPKVLTVTKSQAKEQHDGEIPSSFGMDFLDVRLESASEENPLRLGVQPAPRSNAKFAVEVWGLRDQGDGPEPELARSQGHGPTKLKTTIGPGGLSRVTPAIDTTKYTRLGLIITRIDTEEGVDPVGQYTIIMR